MKIALLDVRTVEEYEGELFTGIDGCHKPARLS